MRESESFLYLFRNVFKGEDIGIPAEKLAGYTGYSFAFTYADAVGGIRMFKYKKKVREESCIDRENHVYVFCVQSEKSRKLYDTTFSHIGRGGKSGEIRLADLDLKCTCKRGVWAPHTKGGRIRICKHMFASMLYLVHKYPESLPKFRQLVKFLFLAVAWANPSETVLKATRMPRKKQGRYEKKWRETLHSVHALKEALPTIEDDTLRKLWDFFSSMQKLPAPLHQSIPALEDILRTILGGTGEGEYRRWFEKICFEVLSREDVAQTPGTLEEREPEKIILNADTMREQLEAMKAIAETYAQTGSEPLVRGAMVVWEEGVRCRAMEAKALRDGAKESQEYSNKTLESIKKEIALVLALWYAYADARDLLSEIAEEVRGLSVQEAFRRLPK